ncbi:hypothetical protein ElyMa_002006200 [Elysia marginata]|uniref:Uncharacterized protein n=1 Tax=Elysia marginata TaxID=1093978 RepID=A0AAV4F394_9GAST|nr:hypothetical protein ElyMa_002006200 [Elysia marginata]
MSGFNAHIITYTLSHWRPHNQSKEDHTRFTAPSAILKAISHDAYPVRKTADRLPSDDPFFLSHSAFPSERVCMLHIAKNFFSSEPVLSLPYGLCIM